MTVKAVYEETYTGTEAERPVFTAMMSDLLTNGCRTIVVESLDRFARDLSVQLQLTALLASRGIRLVNASTGQDVTAAMQQDPMMRAMVQIQGVFSELDKRLTVAKLANRGTATVRLPADSLTRVCRPGPGDSGAQA